jgi:hypothetical protein
VVLLDIERYYFTSDSAAFLDACGPADA